MKENAKLLEQAKQQARDMVAFAPKESAFPIVKDYPRLENVDHALSLEKREYKKMLKVEQEKLRRLELDMYIKRVPMIIMYEGWDAAGKGGSIRRRLRRWMRWLVHHFPFTGSVTYRAGSSSSVALLDAFAKSWSRWNLRSQLARLRVGGARRRVC